MTRFWDHDSEFVALIYHAVFTHDETSNQPTSMGSRVVPMTSTRRQDYSLCQYQLVEHFPNFLRAAPLAATRAVIQSLNLFIISTRIFSYHQGDVIREDTFNFRGKSAYFVQDSSHGWDEEDILDEPIRMADVLFEFIEELAMSKDSLLDSLLDVFRDYVRAAFFWKRLLKAATQFPEVFAPRLFELCIAKPIQMGTEVLYELGTFLATAAVEFTPKQRLQIEKSILRLPGEGEKNNDFLERRRDRLIVQIPLNLLQTDAAKKIREELECENGIPEDRLSVDFDYQSTSYTEDGQLQEQKVDTTIPDNQEVKRFFDPLDKFCSDWLNDKPTEEATKLIVPLLQEGYATITGDTRADKEIVDLFWHKLTACAAILSRVVDNSENHLFVLCRQVLLHGAKHELPNLNPILDDQSNSLPYYSPFPRHEAAQGLLWLTVRQPDAEMLDAIEALRVTLCHLFGW